MVAMATFSLLWLKTANSQMSVYRTIGRPLVFSSVSVAEWPPFGKELPTRLAICSLH